MSGLIRLSKYLTQVGQLVVMGTNDFGDPISTSIQTVACCVYQDSFSRREGFPQAIGGASHSAIIPSGISSLGLHSHLVDVVDLNGQEVISISRITAITQYGDWRHGNKFTQLSLDVGLG